MDPLQEKSNMKITPFFFSFAVTNLLQATVDGAASFDSTVFCSRIVPNATAEVCAVAEYTSPSPATFPNGTTVYLGGYSSTYTIVKGLKEGDMFDGSSANNAGILITVARDDSDICTVSVALNDVNTVCNKCEYCGEDSYKADCSNVKNGRKMFKCLELGDDDVFFPLNASAVPKVTSPVRAPVAGPRRVPVKTPVAGPRRVPVKTPVAGPRRVPVKNPVAGPRRVPVKTPVAGPRRVPVTRPRTAPVPTPVDNDDQDR